jgi:radical SAM enzyme (TIGR01210 family)
MQPAYYRVSPVNINGESSKRLMIVFKTRGCEYAKKTGGCTVCGFMFNAEETITSKDIISQLDYILQNVDIEGVEEIDILTLGSFFNDSEVEPETRTELLGRISQIEQIKRVAIESRAEYVTVEKIRQAKEILGDKILEFGIGLESANDHIRNKIIKKGLTKRNFEKTVEKVKEAGANLLVYLLIKPPYLSEFRAIEDAIQSAKYVFSTAEKYGVSARAAFEPVFVCVDTQLEKLYMDSQYRLLNLWSVVEVIKQSHQYGNIFIGLSDEDLSSERMPHSCPKCYKKIVTKIERFNSTQDISELAKIDCECKKQYISNLKKGEI